MPYETISECVAIRARVVFPDKPAFTPEESNQIIRDLVKKVERYGHERGRDMRADYHESIDPSGKRITEAVIESKDKVIQGKINYNDKVFDFRSCVNTKCRIDAEFDFMSEDNTLEDEYLGLTELLQNAQKEYGEKYKYKHKGVLGGLINVLEALGW